MTVLTRPEGNAPGDLNLSRRSLATAAAGGLFFTQYATAALAQSAQPVVTDTMGIEVADAQLVFDGKPRVDTVRI